MINKLIIGRIIEIMVVITFVLGSIPLWNNFEEKISNADITTLDDIKLDYSIITKNNSDTITISNSYYINKNYKIELVLNNSINEESLVIINNEVYYLKDFTKIISNGKYIYTLVDNTINAQDITYEIVLNLDGEDITYSYILEEKINI